jgi:TonB-dependent SusC/RagA subfamily outer membrane receptor
MKTKSLRYIIVSLSIVLLSFTLLKDNNFIARITALLQQYNEKMPDERVYLHIDKPIYKPGEDIWFSAYLVSGAENIPSTVSHVIYVELLSPKGNVVRNTILYTRNGNAKGTFHLNNDDVGGLYRIRAYTQWMKNFGEESFYKRDIPVQRYIAPRLLMKIDFEREAYGPGDTVRATLFMRNLEDQPLVYQPLSALIQLGGKDFSNMSFETDMQGKARIIFSLPDILETRDGLLSVAVSYKGRNESVSKAIPIVLNNITLDFFPEGGNLVTGIKTRLAFKAVNEFGKPADISGVVYDEEGKEVIAFSSFHDGMGAFDFKPEKGRKYHAVIINPSNIKKIYPLPEVYSEGFVMNIKKDKGEKVEINIKGTKPINGNLIIQSGGKIYYSKEIKISGQSYQGEYSLAGLPAGIARITFFDDNDYPVCERLVFANYNKTLKIKIKTDKEVYAPREKVTMNIETSDFNNKPVSAYVSVAVTTDKIISMADDRQDNILSYLLLSSEVRGKIYEPVYYFSDNEPGAEEALDYLLLTQGWRRFAWKEVIEKKYAYQYFPERSDVVSGKVVDSYNKPVPSVIIAEEWGSDGRVIKFETDDMGHFVITDVNPIAGISLYAHAKGVKNKWLKIIVDDNHRENNISNNYPVVKETHNEIPEIIRPDVKVTEPAAPEAGKQNLNLSMAEDIQKLDEVVVVGYGTQKKSCAMGTIVSVEEPAGMPGSVTHALSGRVSGVSVIENLNNNGASADIKIRGLASIEGSSPLIIIDGFPYDDLDNGTLSPFAFITADDIEKIEILKGPSAANYGNNSSDGVILITTKSNIDYSRYWYHSRNFITCHIQPRGNYSWSREFYSPVYDQNIWPDKRTDFRETVFWRAGITTSSKGKAQLTFYNSDEITAFRAVAEGISADGLIGRAEYTYTTQKPVSIDVKLPSFVSTLDTINLNLTVTNKLPHVLSEKLFTSVSGGLQVFAAPDSVITLASGQSRNYTIRIIPIYEDKNASITIGFGKGKYRDEVTGNIEIFKTGFPCFTSFSGEGLSKAYSFDCSDALDGTIRCSFMAYPSVIENLLSGIESIIREPYGCFEQVSSSTYPNIMVLQYLKNSGKSQSEIENKALNYIEQGYRRLVSYETSKGGFEWFGHLPPHEGLTAYGLLEFTEMKKVYDGVSNGLIERTRQWLLNRRDGNGNFRCNNGKYGFAGAGQKVTNAYLLYALTETGTLFEDIQQEYKKAYEEAVASHDDYRMALMANTAVNLQRQDDAEKLLALLAFDINKRGLSKLSAENTIVNSYGKSASVETASLIMLALLKSGNYFNNAIIEITNYLSESRSYGGFGSTQATILALKALTTFQILTRDGGAVGSLRIMVNDYPLPAVKFKKGVSSKLSADNLEKYLVKGSNTIKVEFDTSGSTIPYSFDLAWKTLKPQSDPLCKVQLSTNIEKGRIAESNMVRLSNIVINKSNEVLPMTVVLVGIPGGLTPLAWQLKKLQEERVIDYYELKNNYIVFYLAGMNANEIKNINIDLKAEVPGIYTAPASSAYLYYCNEHRYWTDGVRVIIDALRLP